MSELPKNYDDLMDQVWETLKVKHPRIEQLEQKLREKEARIARLENGIKIVLFADNEISELAAESLREKLNESPQASLAEIEAAAVERMLLYFAQNGLPYENVSKSCEEYAASLREGK